MAVLTENVLVTFLEGAGAHSARYAGCLRTATATHLLLGVYS